MPESAPDRKIFSLLDVMQSIQKTLTQRYGSAFWVKAEMNKLNHYPHSGHCYPELVEKRAGKVIAQLRCNLWRDDYVRINQVFLKVLNAPLRDGITMLFCARVTFDPVHGLSLRILDIDPIFTLGELEREKAETISTLKNEGVFNSNRLLPFPLLPQRIAVISVETSKGYADFQNVLDNNAGGYRFFHMLFPSVLQGERAVESIRYQLARIRRASSRFDVVAIIRGGGGEVGLSCFNNLELCRELAHFPLPVLTGIGHATNETVAEMVAHWNAITPTDLANFVVGKFEVFSRAIDNAVKVVRKTHKDFFRYEYERLKQSIERFRLAADGAAIRRQRELELRCRALLHHSVLRIERQFGQHQSLASSLNRISTLLLEDCRRDLGHTTYNLKNQGVILFSRLSFALERFEERVNYLNPKTLLARGYSITQMDGEWVKSTAGVASGKSIVTILQDGTLTSDIKEINNDPT